VTRRDDRRRAERPSRRRFPARPLVGVGAVLLGDRGRVLLVQRGTPPSAGLWTFPGGLVEAGESLRQACRREVAEETGLQVEPRDLCAVAERLVREPGGRLEYHYVIFDFWATIEEQSATAASDAAAVRWVAVEQVAELPHTRGVPEAIKRALLLARGQRPASLLDE
jgi:8-oxo-dGTP diphosphatase